MRKLLTIMLLQFVGILVIIGAFAYQFGLAGFLFSVGFALLAAGVYLEYGDKPKQK